MADGQKENPAIVVLNGEQANQLWILDKPTLTLGRDETADIIVPERKISRQHARFHRQVKDNTTITIIEDLESKNGTWVNGHRLHGQRELSDGDEVHVALVVRIRYIGSGVTAPITHELPNVIPTALNSGRLKLDNEARRVFINGRELSPPLSLPQYRLLELLYVNEGGICTREEVIETVWPDAVSEGISEQAIDALVRRLRDRLTEVDPEQQYVVTVRGHGFRLDNPTED